MDSQDTPVAILKPFSKQSNSHLYREYLRIKFEVFVVELGWSGLQNESGEPIAREDPFDSKGRFLSASTEARVSMGSVRAIPLEVGFPHRELFEHHFCQEEFSSISDRLCTFNALAVLPPHRRKRYRVEKRGWTGTVAQLLMLGLIRVLEEEGLRGAILTAAGIISMKLFLRLGFYVIDSPTVTPLHKDMMANLGIVFGSATHVRAQQDCGMIPGRSTLLEQDAFSLLHYFEHRHQRVLGIRSLESFFGA